MLSGPEYSITPHGPVCRVPCRMRHAKLTPSAHGARWFGRPLPDPGVLDGDLLMRYCQAPRGLQAKVAKAAGSTREAVLTLLADIVSTSRVY